MTEADIEHCIAAGYWPNEKRKPDEVWDIILSEENRRKSCKRQVK